MKTKQSRRDFIRLSATGALGALAISKSDWKTFGAPALDSSFADAKTFGIGLQLYLYAMPWEKMFRDH